MVFEYCKHASRVSKIAFGYENIATSSDNVLHIWTPYDDAPAFDSEVGHSSNITCVCFSEDASKVVTADESQAIVWDAKLGIILKQIWGRGFKSVAISPDGLQLACGCGDKIEICDLQTGKLTKTLKQEAVVIEYANDDSNAIIAHFGKDSFAKVSLDTEEVLESGNAKYEL